MDLISEVRGLGILAVSSPSLGGFHQGLGVLLTLADLCASLGAASPQYEASRRQKERVSRAAASAADRLFGLC